MTGRLPGCDDGRGLDCSRNMAKHRQQEEAAGVSRYIARRFLDDEILECIETEPTAPG